MAPNLPAEQFRHVSRAFVNPALGGDNQVVGLGGPKVRGPTSRMPECRSCIPMTQADLGPGSRNRPSCLTRGSETASQRPAGVPHRELATTRDQRDHESAPASMTRGVRGTASRWSGDE
jgi:hypothetical protein